jgi:GNAT superfamily N-acetyltransferase
MPDEIPLLAGIYQRAIIHSCSNWYDARQLEAWHSFAADAALWNNSFVHTQCMVAVNRLSVPLAFGDWNPASGQIGRLYVDPSAQGTGLGTGILAAIEEMARLSGHRELSLESALNAVDFYMNRGYDNLGNIVLPFNGALFAQCRMRKQW